METWGITLGIYYIWSGKTLEENIGGKQWVKALDI